MRAGSEMESALYRRVLEEAPAQVVVFEQSGKSLLRNQALEELLGRLPVGGSSCEALFSGRGFRLAGLDLAYPEDRWPLQTRNLPGGL